MMIKNKLKNILSAMLLTLMIAPCSKTIADDNIVIPQMGSVGVRGMTVLREKQYGDYFMRKVRGSKAIAYDPVLNEYISSIGNRLVLVANDVKFPFEFFLSADKTLNASAFFGGKVQVNAGLFHYAKTEDEFASVLAHEISHVTQRHLARFIEDQQDKQNISMASIVGSIALAIINPTVGLAALSTTSGAMAQGQINFTRDNEFEADRIGINLLSNANFNPMGMSDLFRRLYNRTGNINSAYAMLSDHPLSEVRVAEAYNRARNLPKRDYSKSANFMFAKARVDVRYMGLNLKELKTRLDNTAKVNANYKNYALALIAFENRQYDEAKAQLAKLNQDNDFVIDLQTDIDLATNSGNSAISRLEQYYSRRPNDTAISVNFANALLEQKQFSRAIKVLNKHLKKHDTDAMATEFLAKAYVGNKDLCNAYQTYAYLRVLESNYKQSTEFLTDAFHVCKGNDREIVKAKVQKYNQMKNFDDEMEKNN